MVAVLAGFQACEENREAGFFCVPISHFRRTAGTPFLILTHGINSAESSNITAEMERNAPSWRMRKDHQKEREVSTNCMDLVLERNFLPAPLYAHI
jgi:hypothetical protein